MSTCPVDIANRSDKHDIDKEVCSCDAPLHLCEVLHLLRVAGGVDAEDAGVVVGVVVGGGAVHPVVPVQHPRVQTRVHTCTRLTLNKMSTKLKTEMILLLMV